MGASDLRQGLVALVQFGFQIASIVVFLKWFRRAYGNLHRSGLSIMKFTEPMALWSWFIPIISLWRPYHIMSEIWTETQNQIKQLDTSYVVSREGPILGVWWFLFLISNFVGNYLLRTTFKDETIDQLIDSSIAMLISDGIHVIEGVLVISIVQRISSFEYRLKSSYTKFNLATLEADD